MIFPNDLQRKLVWLVCHHIIISYRHIIISIIISSHHHTISSSYHHIISYHIIISSHHIIISSYHIMISSYHHIISSDHIISSYQKHHITISYHHIISYHNIISSYHIIISSHHIITNKSIEKPLVGFHMVLGHPCSKTAIMCESGECDLNFDNGNRGNLRSHRPRRQPRTTTGSLPKPPEPLQSRTVWGIIRNPYT